MANKSLLLSAIASLAVQGARHYARSEDSTSSGNTNWYWGLSREVLRLLSLVLTIFALAWSSAAVAGVTVSFQSFNGSVLFGRYPHAFVVLEGKDDSGNPVSENYGFTAKRVTPAILSGPVEHLITTEKAKYIASTNRHFTIELTDAQHRRIQQEVAAWRSQPGKYYDLDSRNCIHFVGRIAELAGLKVSYPRSMLRKPRAWLDHIAAMNPEVVRARGNIAAPKGSPKQGSLNLGG